MKANKFFIICVVAALLITAAFIAWKRNQQESFNPIINHSEITKSTLDTLDNSDDY